MLREITRLQWMLDERDELLSHIERLSRQRERFAEAPVIVDENMPNGVPWALIEMPIPGITGSVPRELPDGYVRRTW